MPTGFHPDGFMELGRAALLPTFALLRYAWNAATVIFAQRQAATASAKAR
jgi:hypothetical protein